jgi:hypothetical protein
MSNLNYEPYTWHLEEPFSDFVSLDGQCQLCTWLMSYYTNYYNINLLSSIHHSGYMQNCHWCFCFYGSLHVVFFLDQPKLRTVLLLTILDGIMTEMRGAISLMVFSDNHLSFQNKVVVPSPVSVTTTIEKKASSSAFA